MPISSMQMLHVSAVFSLITGIYEHIFELNPGLAY